MRPRAGQRNSGSVARGVGLRAGQRDLCLRRARFEVAGRRLVDRELLSFPTAWPARPRRPRRLRVLGRGLLRLPGGFLGLGASFSFSSFPCPSSGLGRLGVGDVLARFLRLLLLGAGDGVAVGVIDGHHDAHPALHLRGAGKAVGGEKRGGGHAVAARNRVQCLAIGDDDRRAAGGCPAHGRAADRLRPRERSGARPERCGRRLRQRRRRHPGRRRAASAALLANGLENGLSLWAEAGDVGRTSRQQKKAKPGQRKTRKRASS